MAGASSFLEVSARLFAFVAARAAFYRAASSTEKPPTMANRRHCLQLAAALGWGSIPLEILANPRVELPVADDMLQTALARIEQRSGGQLGVQVNHPRSGRSWGWRQDERFLMCSSFKLLLAAQALRGVADSALALGEVISFGPADLVPWSPITEPKARQGRMSIGDLCAATLATSDNTAANLLITRLGGPPAFTAFMRSLGDEVTRLDRTEPAMNAHSAQGDWDTSSPRAMGHSLQRLLLDDGLPPAQRAQLKTWLLASITGGRRLKAGLPKGWTIASKTGTSDRGSTNDVGVAWSAAGDACVVAAFIRDSTADHPVREACLADVARLVARWQRTSLRT
jgi:beta-lactamase class A